MVRHLLVVLGVQPVQVHHAVQQVLSVPEVLEVQLGLVVRIHHVVPGFLGCPVDPGVRLHRGLLVDHPYRVHRVVLWVQWVRWVQVSQVLRVGPINRLKII